MDVTPANPGMLTLDELRERVAAGEVDTVLVGITDMQGRLQGKRCSARFFLDEVAAHGTEGCNYLLAVDVDMNTVEGYEMASWERGYGDLLMTPDFGTLRSVPWHPGTALVVCDVQWLDGSPLPVSPRQVLRRQLERLDDLGYVAYAAALVTHGLVGWPELEARKARSADTVYAAPGVTRESGIYFMVTAVLLAVAGLLAAWFLAGAHPRRPWDAMLFAASPALVLAGLINWDLLAVTMAAGAMWAWSRGRAGLTGVLVGLGTATKLYPLFLLGALLVVCLRRRRMQPFLVATGAAAVAWLLVNAPALVLGLEEWKVFWSFNSERGADLGSLWLVWQQAGNEILPETINTVSWVFFTAVCVGVLTLGLLAPRPPRVAQLAFLIVLGFLLVNKVYSPQYVLWLLPFAVLARPRWRDILVWQAGEVFYFGAVWLYLGGFTAPGASGQPDRFYWLAIGVRVLCQLYLAVVVVRDIIEPERDPVRTDCVTDDPMQPTTSASRAPTGVRQ